jgi:hypothetical protein
VRLHRSATALLLVAACGKDPRIERRTVLLHVPRECALASDAYAVFYAYGDYERTPDAPSEEGQFLHQTGQRLSKLPAEARALIVDVAFGERAWRGQAEVPSSGDVDVLLWPHRSPCRLTGDVGDRAGATMTALRGSRLLIVGGAGATVPATFEANLATGVVRPLPVGLLTPRVRATVTAFEGGAVVAGGTATTAGLLDTAEVYRRETGDFDGAPIRLSEGRAEHGAVDLVTGETLLVGGVGASGEPLASLEVVDPVARRAKTGGLARLAVPRTRPIVLRLASGEVLVAGGFDARGEAIDTLEWLTADGHNVARRPQPLVARSRHAFIALPTGGALAVIVPDGPTDAIKNVWSIGPSGVPEAATPIAEPLGKVRLFQGTQGQALLWTGERWMQWQPWSGSFAALDLGTLGPIDTAASAEPGLPAWLAKDETGTRVVGLRVDATSVFGPLPAGPLLAGSTAYTAPDRGVTFDPSLGAVLGPLQSVFVTDVTFAGVRVAFDPTGELPHIVLRDERGFEIELGSAACPRVSSTLERRGAVVRAGDFECPARLREDARVTVGLRGAPDHARSTARNLRLSRL